MNESINQLVKSVTQSVSQPTNRSSPFLAVKVGANQRFIRNEGTLKYNNIQQNEINTKNYRRLKYRDRLFIVK